MARNRSCGIFGHGEGYCVCRSLVWVSLCVPKQDRGVIVKEPEAGPILNLGRRFSLSFRDAVDDLEASWTEVASRIKTWRQRRGT